MLDDEGRKYVRERNRNTGEISTTNHYYNIDESKQSEFDRNWNSYNNKIGFMEKNA